MTTRDELPEIVTDSPPNTWAVKLLCVKGILSTLGGYYRPMTLADLCALVAALPVEQRDRLLAPYIGEGAHISGRLLDVAERIVERDLASEREAHERTKAELEQVKRERHALMVAVGEGNPVPEKYQP
jgi:hypothetical protein